MNNGFFKNGARFGSSVTDSMPFQIRLEVEGMKTSVLHRIGAQTEDLTHRIDEQVTRAIEKFDYDGAISQAVESALKQVVTEVAQRAVRNVVYSPEVQSAIGKEVVSAMKRGIQATGWKFDEEGL